MTQDELLNQITWFEAMKEMLDRKEYRAVRESIEAAIKLLRRQESETER